MTAAHEMDDHELARNARAGCMSSFEALVTRYEARMFGFILSKCRDRDDAQELTQDTFVRAWRGMANWDEKRAFKTWLFAIARNRCVDHYRSRVEPVELESAPGVDEKTPDELLAKREEAHALWDIAARTLPSSQFECLWLRYAEDMDVAEIAAVVKKAQTHVKVLLFRARGTLARRMKVQCNAPANLESMRQIVAASRTGTGLNLEPGS